MQATQKLTTIPTYDVTSHAAEIDLSALQVITWTPAWLSRAERLTLFSLIFSLRPMRYMEIGTFQGGSALIVAAAMDTLNHDGRMFCVDPNPRMKDEHWQQIQHRTTLFQGYSPDVLTQVAQAAGAPFDFVFIDGDHSYKGVLRDARGVMPYVSSGSYLLFHDAFFPDVERGLNDFAREFNQKVIDCGPITREITVQQDEGRPPIPWGGFRLMRVR